MNAASGIDRDVRVNEDPGDHTCPLAGASAPPVRGHLRSRAPRARGRGALALPAARGSFPILYSIFLPIPSRSNSALTQFYRRSYSPTLKLRLAGARPT